MKVTPSNRLECAVLKKTVWVKQMKGNDNPMLSVTINSAKEHLNQMTLIFVEYEIWERFGISLPEFMCLTPNEVEYMVTIKPKRIKEQK